MTTELKDKGNVLRLHYGNDKRNPNRPPLNLSETACNGNIFLHEGGLSANIGQRNLVFKEESIYRDGSERAEISNLSNTQFSITMDFRAGSTADLHNLQSAIKRYITESRLNQENSEGDTLWLEYRWADNLASLPAPVWGQLSTYLRVISLELVQGASLQNPLLASNYIENVVANIIAAPVPEGLPQKAMFAQGFIEIQPDGLQINRGIVAHNLFANPSFANPTAFDNGWDIFGSMLAIREQRDGFTRSFSNAVRLVDRSLGGSSFRAEVPITINVDYWMSAYIKMPGGVAPTTNEITLKGVGATSTLFKQIDNTDTYLIYGRFKAIFSDPLASVGFLVWGAEIASLDDAQITIRGTSTNEYPPPFANGEKLGCSWTGTAHDSTTDSADGKLIVNFENEMAGQFTVAMWFTPKWDNPPGVSGDMASIWNYTIDSDNYVSLRYDPGTFDISRRLLASSVNVQAAFLMSYGQAVHLVITQDKDNLNIYINGNLEDTVAAPGALGAGGDFRLGFFDVGSDIHADGVFDNPVVFDVAISAAQVQQLYINENPIKARFNEIGMPPFCWAQGATSADLGLIKQDVENGDSPWCVVGCAGDIEAKVKWEIEPPLVTPSQVYWLARKDIAIANDFVNPDGLLDVYLGIVKVIAPGDTQTTVNTTAQDIALTKRTQLLKGYWQVAGSFIITDNVIDVSPMTKIGMSSSNIFNSNKLPVDATSIFYAFQNWDFVISWWDSLLPPYRVFTGFSGENKTLGNATIETGELFLIPSPFIRVESESLIPAIEIGDKIIIDGKDSYLVDVSFLDQVIRNFTSRGAEVTVVPKRYNLIFLYQAEETVAYDAALEAKLTPIITPRWMTPGGPV